MFKKIPIGTNVEYKLPNTVQIHRGRIVGTKLVFGIFRIYFIVRDMTSKLERTGELDILRKNVPLFTAASITTQEQIKKIRHWVY